MKTKTVPVNSFLSFDSVLGGEDMLRAFEERRRRRVEGEKKKTGIEIDFSIMLAVSRGRHMF